MTFMCLSSHLNLAVIGPLVTPVFQILAPIILLSTFTLIVAIPRWFLGFSYWLWCRNAPAALRGRTIPGVKSRVFQGVAQRQFDDEYAFVVPDRADLPARIADFFRQRGATAEPGGEPLSFARGHRICSMLLPHLIPWREKDFAQHITVRTSRTRAGQAEIRLCYCVQVLCMLRLPPAGLQDEAAALCHTLPAS